MLAEWSRDREGEGAQGRCASQPSPERTMALAPARKLVYRRASQPDCGWPGLRFLSGGDRAAGCRAAFSAEAGACSEGLGRQGPGEAGDLTGGQSGDPKE